eukprot:gnl/MRDRNA2_/MRDRNA2_91391_c0_seq1.p1 gnl/MRDRNA2_/MRDRNA2_91391_c0~~gnl/MRDRNA2_/MRDRNA2_91391_c0_seq1.p1  ORF type:complete len:289 (+),score=51.02 gnl/MRDRNA2_/MRDRNA2_91391_c0_seq1:60-869(+)
MPVAIPKCLTGIKLRVDVQYAVQSNSKRKVFKEGSLDFACGRADLHDGFRLTLAREVLTPAFVSAWEEGDEIFDFEGKYLVRVDMPRRSLLEDRMLGEENQPQSPIPEPSPSVQQIRSRPTCGIANAKRRRALHTLHPNLLPAEQNSTTAPSQNPSDRNKDTSQSSQHEHAAKYEDSGWHAAKQSSGVLQSRGHPRPAANDEDLWIAAGGSAEVDQSITAENRVVDYGFKDPWSACGIVVEQPEELDEARERPPVAVHSDGDLWSQCMQ